MGGVLFAIFWMGSLAVFDKEIDRWMAPTTRLPGTASSMSLETLRPWLDDAASVKSPVLFAALPTDREPTLRLSYRVGADFLAHQIDPATGSELPDSGTWAATGFLYPFHYNLHIRFAKIGIWLVGLAGMAMLALCVSGVAIHRKIFANFFTFRPRKKSRRVLLDLHSAAGVLGLPFHFLIALSGLTIFATTYFPSGWQAVYKDAHARDADTFGNYNREASGNPGGPIASLNAMALEAQRIWEGDSPGYLQVRYPGDASAYVAIARPSEDRVTPYADTLSFDAATGTLLHRSTSTKPIAAAQRYLTGMHMIQFRHWALRGLYFGMGLTGCVLIATGYLFWLESRRKRHAQLGLAGVRVVEGLTIGSVTGIITATLAFFIANRLLPLGASFAGAERAALEMWAFYLTWLAAFAHAWLRPGRAWVEQCRTIAVLAVITALLNWITTGDHLIRSLAHRHLWPIAGMDLMLIAGASAAALAAYKFERRVAMPLRCVGGNEPVSQAAE